ncbi:hypothetical protein BX600DRAFT_516980 [Xylariales sp. PMI_506]|nr:hypothetical protein BX600DRAFT_516980 [Xylariales sp. PMI_506]
MRPEARRNRKPPGAGLPSTGNQSVAAFRRQTPVSCRFCRSQAPSTDVVTTSATPVAVIPSGSNLEIIERIRRLEETVASHAQSWDLLAGGGLPALDVTIPGSSKIDIHEISTRKPSSLCNFYQGSSDQISFDLVFDVAPLAHLVELPPWLTSSRPRPARCVWLPQKHEAQELLSKYIEDVSCVHNFCYNPSLQPALDKVYAELGSGIAPHPARMVLLLSFFVSASFFWTEADKVRGLDLSVDEIRSQAVHWAMVVRDTLDCCRSEAPSLEIVQALIIVSCVARGSDAIGPATRYLQTAITMARELGLHRCDHPDRPCFSVIQRQVERRTWWYIVSFDWMGAILCSGPEKDNYLLHPGHMLVDLPAHINDADLVGVGALGAIHERPLTELTDMSYTVQRIRLATISRRLVDLGPNPQPVDVARIYTDLRVFERKIPTFFRMTAETLSNTYELDHAAACRFVTQGHVLRAFLPPHYRRLRELLSVLPISLEQPPPRLVETESRVQRFVVHLDICLKSTSVAGRSLALGSNESDRTHSLRFPSSSPNDMDGHLSIINGLGLDGVHPSVDSDALDNDSAAALGEYEWDNLPDFRFF